MTPYIITLLEYLTVEDLDRWNVTELLEELFSRSLHD